MHMDQILKRKEAEHQATKPFIRRMEWQQLPLPRHEPEVQHKIEEGVVLKQSEERAKSLLLRFTKLLKVDYPDWAKVTGPDGQRVPMLRFTPDEQHSYGLMVPRNSIDEAALHEIASLLQEAREFLNG